MVDETPKPASVRKIVENEDEEEEDPPIPQNYKFYNIDGAPT